VTTHVEKWGDSLGLRLPKSVAAEARISEGDTVEIVVDRGAIVVRRVGKRYSLEELVSGITKANRHAENEWGASTGREL